ncbi:hypothetical protein EIN_492240, partial [Entamoeba invadens IP1]
STCAVDGRKVEIDMNVTVPQVLPMINTFVVISCPDNNTKRITFTTNNVVFNNSLINLSFETGTIKPNTFGSVVSQQLNCVYGQFDLENESTKEIFWVKTENKKPHIKRITLPLFENRLQETLTIQTDSIQAFVLGNSKASIPINPKESFKIFIAPNSFIETKFRGRLEEIVEFSGQFVPIKILRDETRIVFENTEVINNTALPLVFSTDKKKKRIISGTSSGLSQGQKLAIAGSCFISVTGSSFVTLLSQFSCVEDEGTFIPICLIPDEKKKSNKIVYFATLHNKSPFTVFLKYANTTLKMEHGFSDYLKLPTYTETVPQFELGLSESGPFVTITQSCYLQFPTVCKFESSRYVHVSLDQNTLTITESLLSDYVVCNNTSVPLFWWWVYQDSSIPIEISPYSASFIYQPFCPIQSTLNLSSSFFSQKFVVVSFEKNMKEEDSCDVSLSHSSRHVITISKKKIKPIHSVSLYIPQIIVDIINDYTPISTIILDNLRLTMAKGLNVSASLLQVESYPPATYTVNVMVQTFSFTLTKDTLFVALPRAVVQVDSLFIKKLIDFLPPLPKLDLKNFKPPKLFFAIDKSELEVSFRSVAGVVLPLTKYSATISALLVFLSIDHTCLDIPEFLGYGECLLPFFQGVFLGQLPKILASSPIIGNPQFALSSLNSAFSSLGSRNFVNALNKSTTGIFGVLASIADTVNGMSENYDYDITLQGPRPESFKEGMKLGVIGYHKKKTGSTLDKLQLSMSSVTQFIKLAAVGAFAEFEEKGAKRVGKWRSVEEYGPIRKYQDIGFEEYSRNEKYVCHIKGSNDTWIVVRDVSKFLLLMNQNITVQINEIGNVSFGEKCLSVTIGDKRYSLDLDKFGKREKRFCEEITKNEDCVI